MYAVAEDLEPGAETVRAIQFPDVSHTEMRPRPYLACECTQLSIAMSLVGRVTVICIQNKCSKTVSESAVGFFCNGGILRSVVRISDRAHARGRGGELEITMDRIHEIRMTVI